MAHERYKPKAPAVMANPNVIPMADIMLVLLIIFMVVTPMLQKGMSVDLARVNNPTDMQAADRDDAIIVAVTSDGSIFLGTSPRRPRRSATDFAAGGCSSGGNLDFLERSSWECK